jgi:hypothetical protein
VGGRGAAPDVERRLGAVEQVGVLDGPARAVEEADAAAIRSDWQAVGDSIEFAIDKISREIS